MKVVPSKPYIWFRINGRLMPPPHIRDRNREFIGTDDGLLVVRRPVEDPVFDPNHDEIQDWHL